MIYVCERLFFAIRINRRIAQADLFDLPEIRFIVLICRGGLGDRQTLFRWLSWQANKCIASSACVAAFTQAEHTNGPFHGQGRHKN